jgi:hypothetical protein
MQLFIARHKDCHLQSARLTNVREEDLEIRKRVERLILAYLARNPTAEDTVDGILQWWLVHQEIRFRMREVEAALAELTYRGFVIQKIGEDLSVRYRINPNEYEEIQSSLDV